MPTATTTKVRTASNGDVVVAVKGSIPADSTLATLRCLYPRAARAFLHRDIALTESLLSSAFALLPPPQSLPDRLSSHRRKYDLLRITFQSTLYPSQSATLPQVFLTSLYTQSLQLFTPLTSHQRPNPAYLPSQILITLVLSSLKLNCPDVGRGMVEDWLARRGQNEEEADEEGKEDYEKVLEVFICHVLPRLEQWDYAEEFLEYESQLSPERREHLKSCLHIIHTQSLRPPPQPSPPPQPTMSPPLSPSPSRMLSPASSSASTSSLSSLSTTSTHTIIPRTPRPALPSSSSATSTTTVTRRDQTNGDARSRTPTGRNGIPRSPRAHPLEPPILSQLSPPSTVALFRAYLSHYLTPSRLSVTTFVLLFVVFPVLSLLLRLRRRRLRIANSSSSSTAEIVRRRLASVPGGAGGGNLLVRGWSEFVRAVGDAVRMGGSGLV